jgi:ethanolamine utilization cobalamin adenosyltransferase
LPRAVEDLLYQIKERNTRSIEAEHSLYESQHARERLNGLRNHALGLKVSIAQVFMEKTYDLLNDAEIANKKSVNEVDKVSKKPIGSMDGLAKVLT